VVCGQPGSPTSGDGLWSPFGPHARTWRGGRGFGPHARTGHDGPSRAGSLLGPGSRLPVRACLLDPAVPGSRSPDRARLDPRPAARLDSAAPAPQPSGSVRGPPTGRVAHHRNSGIRLSTAHHRRWGTPAVHRARWVHGARRVTVPGGCMGPSVTTVPGARMGPKQRPRAPDPVARNSYVKASPLACWRPALSRGTAHGDRALEAAPEVLGGLALGGSPLGVDAGGGIDAQSGQGDAPQGVVGLAVAASVQPVADGLARGGLRRADPAQARSSVASAEVRGWGPDGHGDVVGDALGVPADAAEQRGSEAAEEP
jgi:hypothetical protein